MKESPGGRPGLICCLCGRKVTFEEEEEEKEGALHSQQKATLISNSPRRSLELSW